MNTPYRLTSSTIRPPTCGRGPSDINTVNSRRVVASPTGDRTTCISTVRNLPDKAVNAAMVTSSSVKMRGALLARI